MARMDCPLSSPSSPRYTPIGRGSRGRLCLPCGALAAATRQMAKEDKKMVEEREAARKSLDDINEKLKDVNIDKKEKAELEEEARRLETVINMFDAGG